MKQRFLIFTTMLILVSAVTTVFFAARYQLDHAPQGYSVIFFNTTDGTIDPSTGAFDPLTITIRNFERTIGPTEYYLQYEVADGTEFKSHHIVPANDMVIVSSPDAVQQWYRDHMEQRLSLVNITATWDDQSVTLRKKILIDSPD